MRLLFVLDLVASVAVVLAFEYAWGSLAFWAPRAAEEINSSTWRLITQLVAFPLDGLSGLALASLLTVVPVGLVAWYPVAGRCSASTTPLVGRRGLLPGCRARCSPRWRPGSSPVDSVTMDAPARRRYLDFGHRR